MIKVGLGSNGIFLNLEDQDDIVRSWNSKWNLDVTQVATWINPRIRRFRTTPTWLTPQLKKVQGHYVDRPPQACPHLPHTRVDHCWLHINYLKHPAAWGWPGAYAEGGVFWPSPCQLLQQCSGFSSRAIFWLQTPRWIGPFPHVTHSLLLI